MTDFIEENSRVLAPETTPLVAILMGTKNGARFLPEQLDSSYLRALLVYCVSQSNKTPLPM